MGFGILKNVHTLNLPAFKKVNYVVKLILQKKKTWKLVHLLEFGHYLVEIFPKISMHVFTVEKRKTKAVVNVLYIHIYNMSLMRSYMKERKNPGLCLWYIIHSTVLR